MVSNNILENIIKIQLEYSNIYVGGSISLILQNVIPFREVSDIDFISDKKTHIYDVFNINDREKHPIIRKYYSNNIRNELFINPNAKFIEYNYDGYIIKLSPIDETIEWKKKFYTKFKNEKHKKDLEFYEIK